MERDYSSNDIYVRIAELSFALNEHVSLAIHYISPKEIYIRLMDNRQPVDADYYLDYKVAHIILRNCGWDGSSPPDPEYENTMTVEEYGKLVNCFANTLSKNPQYLSKTPPH